jgi:predicted ATPase
MELLYIWIEDYKNIKEQGFNFSSKHRFEFIPEKDKDGKIIGGKLHHEENPNHIESFFGENITNVTAIIGENGAGKSTLIEFTRDIFVNSIFIGKPDGIICITKHNQADEKYKIQGYEELLSQVTLISKQENLFEKYSHDKTKNGGFSLPFAKTKVVKNYNPPVLFYSNIYDGKSEFYHSDYIVSISTNYLIEKEKKIHSEDILRQIVFTTTEQLNKFKIKLPSEIWVSFYSEFYIGHTIETVQSEKLHEALYLLENFFNESYSPIKHPEESEILYWRKHEGACETMSYAIISNFLSLFNKGDKASHDLLGEILLNNHLHEKKILDATKNILKKYQEQVPMSPFRDDIKIMIEIIDFFYNQFDNKEEYVKFKITNKNQQKLIRILTQYNKKQYIKSFVNCKWVGLSSGEQSILNLYSRFYDTIKVKKECKELTILIDEGETGFHPQWQKEYLKILIDFLPQIFPDKKIQIILTSHSPFLVSDLPKENIIFLSKNEKGECVVSKLQDRKETFGANIHTLFTDSFFMKGGLMGTFAEKRINEVIAYLNGESIKESLFNGKTPKEQQELAEKYISMIGEPIIRNMLQKQLNHKRLKQVENHEDRIRKLEEELEALRKKGDYPSSSV